MRYVILIFCILFVCPTTGFSTDASAAAKADRIVVEKAKRTLLLYSGKKKLKTYRIALGFTPKGHKVKQGDGRTPEGVYRIDYRNPKSKYHRSLHISYPNAADRKRAKKLGVSPGGDIMIHGLGKDFGHFGKLHRLYDWTLGCIAVTDDEIEEIWKLVPDGTPIEIKP